MATKINLGINRKVGQPNFGSLGASCHVEFELDGPLDAENSARFQTAVARAYAACRAAVERELASQSESANGSLGKSATLVHANGTGAPQPAVREPPAEGSGAFKPLSTPRLVTPNQVTAIWAIARRFNLDLPAILAERYGLSTLESLTCEAASQLIDYLKVQTANDHTVAAGK